MKLLFVLGLATCLMLWNSVEALSILPSPCPFHVPQVKCLINPCRYTTCPKFPDARCIPTNCGKCKAAYFLNGVQLSHAQCHGTCHQTCMRDPCFNAQCPNFPWAECRPNCRTCRPEFFYGNQQISC